VVQDSSTTARTMDGLRWWGLLWLGYFMLAGASAGITAANPQQAAIWLAGTPAFAVLLQGARVGPAAILCLASAGVAAFLLAGLTPPVASTLAVLLAIQTFAAVHVSRAWVGPAAPGQVLSDQRIRHFVLLALAMPAASGAVLAPFAGAVFGWELWPTFRDWTLAQILGAAIMGPAVLVWIRLRPLQPVVAVTVLGFAAATVVALLRVDYPFIFIGLGLLLMAFVRPAAEVALTAALSGLLTFLAVVFDLTTGSAAAAGLAHRLHLTIAITVALPVFVSLLLERAAADRRRLTESEELFRRSMEDSAVGMAILDMRGHVRKANHALAEMLGCEIAALEGRDLADFVYPDDRPAGVELTRRAITERRTTPRVDTRYVRHDGKIVWGQGSASVQFDPETGRPLHIICHIENVDERRRALDAVVAAENRWSFALASARQGVWEIDLRTGRAYHSAVWKEMLGYREDELADTPGLWLTLIHPDDRDMALAMDARKHGGAHAEFEAEFEAEFRMRHKDGRWIWVLDRGIVLERDADGRVLRAIGTHTDITRQRESQERIASAARALQAEKDRLRVTLEAIGDAVICTDTQDRVVFMNPVAETLTGQQGGRAIGRRLAEIYAPTDEESGLPVAMRIGPSEAAGSRQNRAVLLRPDRSRSYIRQVVSPILSAEGEWEGTVIVFQDFTDARTLQRELAHAASHDSLTGLANRARFMEALAELAEGRAAVGAHHMLFIDLDRFKLVNDTAGHVAGDALLKRIASTMQRCMRPGDLVARLGGDEFAAILRGCELAEAERVAASIVAAVRGLTFEWDGVPHSVGASVGIAAIDRERDPAAIVADADKACYAAKAAGRGAVSVWTTPAETRLSA
jgi:diguanylate cyclase (GGDEF)-like protein/PAS domain S-box-containing protein